MMLLIKTHLPEAEAIPEEYLQYHRALSLRLSQSDHLNRFLTEAPVALDVDKNDQPELNLNATEQQIVSILDEYIKPAVASDGGNIVFDSYDAQEKEVHVILQGACSGCPSSTFTLKNGIETMLKEMMPGKVANVVAVNG